MAECISGGETLANMALLGAIMLLFYFSLWATLDSSRLIEGSPSMRSSVRVNRSFVSNQAHRNIALQQNTTC